MSGRSQDAAMPSRSAARALGTRRDGSEPLASPDASAETDLPADPTSTGDAIDAVPVRASRHRPRVIVEGIERVGQKRDRAAPRASLGQATDYPIQFSKVQPPPLRDETLARDRLLEWLSVKIHRRAILLVAEAGYGKTTLLADFSRRTRVRMLWFRLDRGDRDWVGFLAYLVAAVRVHVPDFGESTRSLLRETAVATPRLDAVLDAFLRELGSVPGEASALVFDDFHLVDDSSDVRHIVHELLTRAPERMSFVFASRREPPVRLARLRALGEVAELGTNDLRFDPAETERLFRETYEMRLEPTVLAELGRRTEGWAASLQLVRAALNDRDAAGVRAFISSLSGAEGHLYDYLAEEVVGDLPADLQQFLMRTSGLDVVDLRLGPVAAGVSVDEARELIDQGERHGLFGKGGAHSRGSVRAHPLVRDFLQARLLREVGDKGVREIHLVVAEAAEPIDWQIATRHHVAAGNEASAREVLTRSIEAVLATGAYGAAQELASSLGSGGLPGAAGLILESRVAQQRTSVDEGVRLAQDALDLEPSSQVALVNLVTARNLAGDPVGTLQAARILGQSGHEGLAAIGRAFGLTLETSVDGSVDVAAHELSVLGSDLKRRHADHYLAVSLLNRAQALVAMGDPVRALTEADSAISLLASSSAEVELLSARLARASALAFIGDMPGARKEMARAVEGAVGGEHSQMELAIEIGQIEVLLGNADVASARLERIGAAIRSSTDYGEQALLVRALLHVRRANLDAALADASTFAHGEPRSSVAFEARRLLTKGLIFALMDDRGAQAVISSGVDLAKRQGAHAWARYGLGLSALADRRSDPSPMIVQLAGELPALVSALADLVIRRLSDLVPEAWTAVVEEAVRRPERWREPARWLLHSQREDDRRSAVKVLERIGEATDIQRLHDLGRNRRDRGASRAGLQLARRLADRFVVEDLGRVKVRAAERMIDGGDIRRKVLALLCLLLSKPRFTSTRDEVIDSLWPENDPTSGLNSLNQTVYFLRRVFEPDYRDETSPGYVGQDGETIWIDSELVDCRSGRCFELIRSMPGDPTPDGALALSREYTGRFALDFAYDEWSASYRDTLHAAYLRVIEHAVQIDINAGQLGRGTYLAERAVEVDPEAEEIRIALVRLYRMSGAHAAAAEQYGHYSRAMKELGLDPIPIGDLGHEPLGGIGTHTY